MILTQIQKYDPEATSESAAELIKLWENVVNLIVSQTLAYSNDYVKDLHINLREEVTHELAMLTTFVTEKVVRDRMSGRLIKEIDIEAEREECINEDGKKRISSTAIICAERVWIKMHHERWAPKTLAALKREEKPKVKTNSKSPSRVENNHFIPLSFIKRYWADEQAIYINKKCSSGSIESKRKGVGSWGFRKNLYSDNLEAYFGLLESDAVRPIEMLLKVVPLNRLQREALVGFIVIQRLRNPFFIESLKKQINPAPDGEGGLGDKEYLKAIYESLFSQNDFYDKIARPIMYSKWVVVRSKFPRFVLPDTCNIFGNYESKQYVLMPLTPNDCLVVLPISVDEPRIVPHYILAPESLTIDITTALILEAKESFLSENGESISISLKEKPNEIMRRIIMTITKITADL